MNFECGFVREYDADKKVYIVCLDRTGDVTARRLVNGADKPIPPFARAVCMRIIGLDWVIMGEVDTAQPTPDDNRPKTIDEAVADLDSKLRSLRVSARSRNLPNFRAPGEEVNLAGDATLENRTLDPRSRSRVKVYAYGSVISFASNLCFTLWHRLEGLWFTQCRSFLLRAIGYERSITVSTEDPRLVMREIVQADPLPSQREGSEDPKPVITDRETIEGYVLPADGRYADTAEEIHEAPKVTRGTRETRVDHLAVESDNTTQTERRRLDFVEYEDDGTIKKRTNQYWKTVGNVEDDGAPFKHGSFERWRDWLEISIDNEKGEIRVRDLRGDGQEIRMVEAGVALSRGEQSITLDDDGVTIKAKNLVVESDGDISLTAAKNQVLTAQSGTIDLRA